MSSRLGPLDIECDAPPYPVVCACRDLGLKTPEDVPWRRLSHFRRQWLERRGLFGIGSLAELFGRKEPQGVTCSCRHPLPLMETGTFLFVSGRSRTYQLGQCRRCHTIFWEED